MVTKSSGGNMAINDSFSLSNALNSQAYAYKCWYNYNYCNNTMGIDSKSMSEITQTWNGELSNWRATASNDENAYEISDDDFSKATRTGKEEAQKDTGYEGGKGGMVTRGVADAASGIAGAAVTVGGIDVLGSGVANAAGKVVGKSAGKAVANGKTNAADKSNGAWIIAAPLALATGTAYMASKPNQEQKEACDDLQDNMTDAQAALASAQDDMADYAAEIEEMSDEAQMYNEDANGEIEEQKSEFDLYKESYEALMAKVESGEALTEDEKALLEELVPLMQELGVTMNETIDDTGEAVSDIYDEMGTYQEGYDYAAETMGEVQGLTDYAESFDEATQTMCYVEGGAQTLNAFNGGKAALQAGKFAASGGIFTAWAWGFAAAGAAGAAMSTAGAAQQFSWAGDVGTEIGMREATQDLNVDTTDIYDERIADYEGYMGGVEDLTLDVPDDMEAPEEVPDVSNNNNPDSKPVTTGIFGTGNGTEADAQDKKDENKA